MIILFIDLVPSIIITLIHSGKNAREIEIENALLPFIMPSLISIIFFLILSGLGIFMLVFEGIIYFEVEVITSTRVMKIITSLFILSSISLLLVYSIQIASTLFPLIGTRTRRNNILNGGYSLFRFTFILYFILWAVGINLFDPIFILFGIEFYWFYIVIVFSLFLFICGAILYSIGERKRKHLELDYLNDRMRILSELEDSIELQNINDTKNKLNAIIETLDSQKNYLHKIITKNYDKFADPVIIEAVETLILKKEDDEETVEQEVKNVISSMNSNVLEHIDFINKLIQDINFCVNSNQDSDLYIFRNQISMRITNIKEIYKKIDERPIVAFKWTALLGFFWTLTSSLLNVSLSSILGGIVSTVI